MRRKAYVLTGLAIVVLLMVVGFVSTRTQPKARHAELTKLSDVQSTAANRPACLAKQTDTNLKLSSAEQDHITNTAVAQIIDVPAGTNVDVYIKSYDGSTASGSSIYSGKYGSYNFTAKQTGQDKGSYQGGWKVMTFEACK